MGPFAKIVAGLSLATSALSSPELLRYLPPPPELMSEACGQISSSIAAGNATENHYPTVPAQLAFDCLASVPFNQSAALRLVDGLLPYMKWQSNLAWIKDPPEEYTNKIQPPYDVLKQLTWMRTRIFEGGNAYTSEYEFAMQLYIIFQNARDSNLNYVPDVLGTIFEFGRPVSLVSVSKDGQSVPEPYVYSDVLAEAHGAKFNPSPITHINDVVANVSLTKLANFGNFQDQDALWNDLFYQPAAASTGTAKGLGAFADPKYVFPGATTHLKFANGSEATYNNFAKVLVPFWANVTDGSTLYNNWFDCTQRGRQLPKPTVVGPFDAPGYPNPVIRQKDNAVGGYYLEGVHSDTAVLSIPTFGNKYTQPEVQDTVTKFLTQAKADGKKRLLIDFQSNNDPNGATLLAYDLYELLFPKNKDQPLLERYRAFESIRVLSNATAGVSKQFPRVLESKDNATQVLNTNIFSSSLDYHTDLDVNGQPFPSWQAKFGPGAKQKGDEFSNLFRMNFDDVLVTQPFTNSSVSVHGYGSRKNWTGTQLFDAKNIAVITDGTCGGACAVASQMLRSRQGVHFLTVGGRAAEGPMQHIGSTRGTYSYALSYIQQIVIYMVTGDDDPVRMNSTELNQYWNNMPLDRVALGTAATINFKDAIADGDVETQTPLQFTYEQSDCRMLYTKEMIVNVTALWDAAADATFGREGEYTNHCFYGLNRDHA
ncbi:hypothetical protein A1F94_010685 [Pyrenophora tritici-repentis]|nr:hypothetical protein A1F94_010685 [Pyrenophora tritici-repentis]